MLHFSTLAITTESSTVNPLCQILPSIFATNQPIPNSKMKFSAIIAFALAGLAIAAPAEIEKRE
jgi:hypothetical protein